MTLPPDLLEEMARAMAAARQPLLWSDDDDVAAKAASPLRVEIARARTREECIALLTAALSVLEARGMVIVPREATEEMIKAGEHEPYGTDCAPFFNCHRNDDHRAIWSAMLSAAQGENKNEGNGE